MRAQKTTNVRALTSVCGVKGKRARDGQREVQGGLCLLFDKAPLITSACCVIALALLQLRGVPLQISRLWRGPAPSLQNALVRHSEPHTA